MRVSELARLGDDGLELVGRVITAARDRPHLAWRVDREPVSRATSPQKSSPELSAACRRGLRQRIEATRHWVGRRHIGPV